MKPQAIDRKSLQPGDPRRLLWHYTSWAGFEAIVKSGRIWASKIDCLNDAMEFKHTASALVSTVHELTQQERFTKRVRAEDLNYLSESVHRISSINTCVACFSASFDQLSQWRAYSGGGPGVALGFDEDGLRQTAANNSARLIPCDYEFASLRSAVTPLATRILQLWPDDHVTSEERLREIGKATDAILPGLGEIGPQYKNVQFIEEQEWRIVTAVLSSTSGGWRFHLAKSLVVPHVELDLSHEANRCAALREVLVGPHAHTDFTMSAAMLLLQNEGIEHRATRRTRIPFRNW